MRTSNSSNLCESHMDSKKLQTGRIRIFPFLLIIFLSSISLPRLYASCTCGGSITATIGDGGSTPRPITNYVSSPITSGCYVVKGFIYLPSDFVILGGRFEMESGAEIRVPSGKTLTIRNVTSNGGIYGCDNLWRGLNITSGGTLIMTGTTIQDAQYAVKASGAARIFINDNSILHNYVGVYVPSVGGTMHNLNFNIYDNLFDCTNGPGSLRLSDYSGMSPSSSGVAYAGFEINNANAKIGSNSNPLNQANVIHHMRVGIIGKASNLQCYNTEISDLIPLLTNRGYTGATGDGIGIYVRNNSSLVAVNNTIENTPFAGISSYQSWLMRVTNNEISEVEVGVYDESSVNSAIITANDIYYFRNRGIVVNKPGLLASPSIVSNTMFTFGTEPTSGFQAIGVLLNSVGGNPYVSNNDLSLHSNCIGINLNSCQRVNAVYNAVSINDDSETAIRGIEIACAATPHSHFLSNVVTADEEFELITGFVTEMSNNNRYCCNETYGTDYGYTFFGDCKRAEGYGHNEIRALTGGLFLASSTIVGVQSHKGNKWYGNFPSGSSTTGGAIFQGTALEIKASQFKVHTCNTPYWPPSIFPAQSCNSTSTNWFLLDDGYPEDCGADDICDLVFLPDHDDNFADIDDGDEKIARGLMEVGDYSFTLDYESRRNLFERMWINAGSHSQNSYVDSFYTATQSSTIADFYEVELEIDTLLSFTEEEYDSIQAILLDMSELQDTIRRLDSLFYIAANSSDSTTVILKRDTTFGLIDTLTAHLQGVFSIYKARILSDKDDIIYLNGLIDPVNIIDTNEQIVNDIYLAQLMEADYVLDSAQTAQLLSVASQCPREGGSIVFKARALYQMVDDTLWNDSGCIEDYMSLRSAKKNIFTNNSFDIYPVPASDKLNLRIKSIDKYESIDLEIYNLTGKSVHHQHIYRPAASMVEIPIDKLQSGVFIGIVKYQNEVLHIQRLIISRN